MTIMNNDLISIQDAIDALNGIINRFEQILRDIRESKVDDSVCGMCEYDGAFVGQSGDWCNECPGFEKDDCFKLSDECRKRWLESVKLPSAQQWIPCGERLPEDEEEVIVSVRDDSGDNTLDYSSFGWYACAGDFWVVDNEANERVVAWMPLPAAYQEGGKE